MEEEATTYPKSRFPVLIIPVIAALALILLSYTGWGRAFITFASHGAEISQHAQMEVSGVQNAKVKAQVSTWETGASVIVNVEGKADDPMTLTVPAEWKLQEVRGVNIRDVVQSQNSFYFALPKDGAKLTFKTNTPLADLTLVSPEHSPVLFSLIHIALPAKTVTQMSEIVEDTHTFQL